MEKTLPVADSYFLFVHDHKFRKIGASFYSPGGLPNKVWNRYTSALGRIVVIGRLIEEKVVNASYSRIENPLVEIQDNSNLSSLVVHSMGVIARLPSLNGYKAIRVARSFDIPVMVEVVGCAFDSYWNYSILGKFVAFPAYYLMRESVKAADFVVYVTKYFLEKRYPCKTTKAIQISNVELDDFTGGCRCLTQKPSLILGTLGNVSAKYRGQEYVIRAIPIIEKLIGREVEYWVAGPGDCHYLNKVACKYAVQDKVRFCGAINHGEVFQWLACLDLYLQPSLAEGLSRSLIEAMSIGIPCIASDCGGNPELLDAEYIFRINQRNAIPEQIAKMVYSLMDSKRYCTVSARNIAYISNEFDKVCSETKRYRVLSEFKDYSASRLENRYNI